MKKHRAVLLWIIIPVLIIVIVILSDTYFYRYVFLNAPDVYDYKKLPYRIVENETNAVSYFSQQSENVVKNILPLKYEGSIIENLDTFLQLHYTTAFIIIRNDSILYEKYFNGHTRDTYCKSFSVSKNFISALVGIALEEKLIQSIDDPVVNYIPEFKSNTHMSSVTIRHCLSGSTGFPANNGGTFPWHDNVKVYYSSNIRKLLSTLECETKPGSSFRVEEYSSCLLGLVLEKATKMTVSQYLSQKLWKPLGMEYSALWVLDNKNNGLEVAMSGLTALPIDFAKFGCLYLKNGTWNNKQIISNKWIHESTAPDTNSLSYWDGGYYTDTWWGTLKRDGTYEYSANGHFSQRIYIAPAKNSVIVRFGTQQGGVDWSQFISKLINQL